MKTNGLKFQKWTLAKTFMYPFRLECKGYDLRSAFYRIEGIRGDAFSDTELGFESAYDRNYVLGRLKYANIKPLESENNQ